MLTPLDLVVGLWLVASPTWGATPGFVSPLALAAPRDAYNASRPSDRPASLLELSDEELMARIEADSGSLGSLSIGAPGSGVLFNPVALEAGPRWDIARGADSWGTSETIVAIQIAVDTVHELFADTWSIVIGDISDRAGGRLKRHQTHQSGRDVDFGFYFKSGKATWFEPGTSANMDLPRNWALVRALLTRTDVETILLDTQIQRLLYKYALSIGEDKDWLDRIFQSSRGSPDPVLRHVSGHRPPYHVRFYNTVAPDLSHKGPPPRASPGRRPGTTPRSRCGICSRLMTTAPTSPL